MHVQSRFSRVQLFLTLWTVSRQAPLSMRFSRWEYWSELPCPPPGVLPNPGIEPLSLCLQHWQAGSLQPVPPGKLFPALSVNKDTTVIRDSSPPNVSS